MAWQVRDVARWNGLGDGSLIHPGQRIVLRPTAAASRSAYGAFRRRDARSGWQCRPRPAPPDLPPPAWRWPTDGAIAAGFGEDNAALTGVLIEGGSGRRCVRPPTARWCMRAAA